jgi:hypothetical protein
MDNTLLRAILAMDAYNQGYSPGVLGVGNQIGDATFLKDAVDTTVLAAGVAQAAGFYAAAYTVGSQTIISYRGTDANFVNPLGDTGSDLVSSRSPH